jgi:hypothetical protein
MMLPSFFTKETGGVVESFGKMSNMRRRKEGGTDGKEQAGSGYRTDRRAE